MVTSRKYSDVAEIFEMKMLFVNAVDEIVQKI